MSVLVHSYVCFSSLLCLFYFTLMSVLFHSYVCFSSLLCLFYFTLMSVLFHSYVCFSSLLCLFYFTLMSVLVHSFVLSILYTYVVLLCTALYSTRPLYPGLPGVSNLGVYMV
jgi:hypothetical protein